MEGGLLHARRVGCPLLTRAGRGEHRTIDLDPVYVQTHVDVRKRLLQERLQLLDLPSEALDPQDFSFKTIAVVD